MSGRRHWRVLFLALSLCVLSACVSLPKHSSVNSENLLKVHTRPNLTRFSAPPPRPGATKLQIVRGYLLAMLDYPQSASSVRAFLSPEGQSTWQPQPLVVYARTSIQPFKNGSMRFTVQRLGFVHPRGSWVSAKPKNRSHVKGLTFAKVDGEWRIDNPMPGTLLNLGYFNRYYHQFPLYYFNPAHSVLVPDPIYQLLGEPSQVATSLVRDLLQGPTATMDQVVAGVVPSSTRLFPDVTVSTTGVADVHLTAVPEPDLRLLAPQLSWTLRQPLLGINQVRIIVGGQPLDVPNYGTAISTGGFSTYDPSLPTPSDLYAISHRQLMRVIPTGPHAGAYSPFATSVTKPKLVSSAAVGFDTTAAAVVLQHRTVDFDPFNAGGNQVSAELFKGGGWLLKPSWGPNKELWLVDRTGPQGNNAVVRMIPHGGKANVIAAPGIAGRFVQSFAVSRDGMRFAAIIGHPGNSHLAVAMIDRSAPGRPQLIGIHKVANVAFPFVNLTSVSWYSSTSLAVLAELGGSEGQGEGEVQQQPYQIAIDGSRVTPLTGFLPVLPVSLMTVPNRSIAPVIATATNRLFVREPDGQWTPVPTMDKPPPLHFPSYPG